ncbi:MAG: type II toxin-antitoxin system RelE/ParE family toxin [Candidatus Thiodiazotropha sp.]
MRNTITVVFYRSAAGREHVKDWLKSLDRGDRRTIGEDIKTVEIGWPLGMPLVRKMDANLWEVRSDISDNRIARVLFTVRRNSMILLHGFVKKSRSTPKADLDLAKRRRNKVLKK